MEVIDFIKIIEEEKQGLINCEKEAKKSQKEKEFGSKEWYREQGEIAGFRTAVITFDRIIFKLKGLLEGGK